MNTQLQNEITSDIKQILKHNGVPILDAFGKDTEVSAKVQKEVETSLSMSSINEQYVSVRQNQNTSYINNMFMFGSDLNVKQGAEAYAQAVLNAVNSSDIKNIMKTAIDQQSTTTSNLLAPLLDNLYSIVIIIVIIAALVLGAPLVISLFRSVTKSGGSVGGLNDNVDWLSATSYNYDEL
jgi:hypothetical protein